MVKGINDLSKCFHEIYDKTEIDDFIQTINQSIDTGGSATTANTNNINNIKHGDISTSIQLLEQEETIDNLGGTTGFKIYSVSDENTPSTNGLLLHIGKTDTNNTQIFIDGKNAGYFEDHPHVEYETLEDGRTVAIGEPTIYYDLILECRNIHRIKSVYVWIKAEDNA